MIAARGKTTYIVKLERKHVDIMQSWGAHTDLLFQCYTFPKMSESQKDYWYFQKNYSFTKKSFAVFNQEDQLVGYISLRNIRIFRRTSELGIVFDPNNLNKGYGTDSLMSFISYYFDTMKMNQLNLRVAQFNKRAYQCYLNCGFVEKGIEYNEFEDPNLPVFENEQLSGFRKYFNVENGKLQCQFVHMLITKEIYNRNKDFYVVNS